MDYFGDFPKEYSNFEKSKIVILPIPYDGTSTFVKGADKGPQAIIDASDSLETYDIETNSEVYFNGIHTLSPIFEKESPEKMTEKVFLWTKKLLEKEKFVVGLGGEHSVSIGIIKAFAEKYKDLTVLQFDAHADLRDEYHGSKFNHACVMARAKESCKIVQVGIRSVAVEEKMNIESERMFFSHQIYQNPNWKNEVLALLSGKVYVTIDLDVFDSSLMPSTGTPQPGGLMWNEMMNFLFSLTKKVEIVGFDVVELCPIESNKAPDVLAAKLVYQFLSYIFQK